MKARSVQYSRYTTLWDKVSTPGTLSEKCGRAAGSAIRTLGSNTSTRSTVCRTALVFQLLSNLRNISIRSATAPKPLAPASLYRNVSRFRLLYLSKNRIDYEGDTFEIEMLEALNHM